MRQEEWLKKGQGSRDEWGQDQGGPSKICLNVRGSH